MNADAIGLYHHPMAYSPRTIAQMASISTFIPTRQRYGKSELEASASVIFGPRGATPAMPAVDVKSLHAKVGELTLDNDFY
jgi:hypothetical protein